MQIKSNKITTETTDHIYKGTFEIDRSGEPKEINESLLTDEASAMLRVTAEFLEYGYDKQEVEFTTYFIPLKINNIISISAPDYRIPKDLSKDRFIVKKVTHYFKDGVIKTKIKGVRYD